MEFAATFFYLSVGLAVWIVTGVIVVAVIELIKFLRTTQATAQQVRNSISSFNSDLIKRAVVGGIASVVKNVTGSKRSKGGDKHD